MIPTLQAGGLGRNQKATGGAPPPGSVWNPSAKGAGIVLSNGNQDATGPAGGFNSVAGTASKASGAWAFEILDVAGTTDVFAGIMDSVASTPPGGLGTYIGENLVATREGVGYWGNGQVYFSMTLATGSTAVTGFTTADVLTVALDLTVPQVQFYKNGTLIHTRAVTASKTWFPAASVRNSGKARIITTSLTHLPGGFAEWG